MNSETVRPTPPRRFIKRRKDTSVTPAIGERISGGLITTSRILKAVICFILGTRLRKKIQDFKNLIVLQDLISNNLVQRRSICARGLSTLRNGFHTNCCYSVPE